MKNNLQETKDILVKSVELAIKKARMHNTTLVTWDRKAQKIIEYDAHTLKPLTK